MSTPGIIDRLLESDEPSIRWKVRTLVLGDDPESKSMRALREKVRCSSRVLNLLARRNASGRLVAALGIYNKWQGAHWILASLAELGYPPGDEGLEPIRDQVLEYWLADRFYREFSAAEKPDAYRKTGIPVVDGRYRPCAAQQGNALFYLTRLGIADDRALQLVELLLSWQWPDGGWNCDKNPAARMSSFMETLLPMCGLSVHAEVSGNFVARAAARSAAEVLLERRLFKRRTDGRVIHAEFTRLHYPLYWHYDILGGLKGMATVGLLGDPRSADALELLERKRLPDGGWPAEKRYYKYSNVISLGNDFVDWGGTSSHHMNPWVTVDALSVLKQAGRL